MTKVETEFNNHEEANKWAESEGMIIIMSALNNGKIALTVIKGE